MHIDAFIAPRLFNLKFAMEIFHLEKYNTCNKLSIFAQLLF